MAKLFLERNLLGVEDFLFGYEIVTQTRNGKEVIVSSVNAQNIPLGESTLAESLIHKGEWNAATRYGPLNTVWYNEVAYIYINDEVSAGNEITNTNYWKEFIPRTKPIHIGEWEADKQYYELDIVSLNESSYIAIQDNINITPDFNTPNSDTWRLLAKVDIAYNLVSTEEGRVLAANQGPVIVDLITAEETARIAADTTLQTNINNEAQARADADTAEAQARADADTAEAQARTDADTVLQTNINNEETARIAADTTLQTNIDNLTEDTNNKLANEKTEREAADTTLQTNIDNETQARADADTVLQTNINNEETARIAADTTLQTNIDNESTTRANNDTVLQTNINNEETARIAADTTLQTNIDNESTTRANNDTVLQININNEETARIAADTTLQTNIDNESTTRANNDTTLQTNLDNEAQARADADTAEETARIAADTTLQTNIDNESTTRANNDTTLQTNLDNEAQARADADTAEETARIAADTTLQTNIDNESTTRANNDTTLQTNIDNEATTRANNDTTLQTNIDLKAPIASPTFTGTAKAPTPTVSTSDTTIATTKFVNNLTASTTRKGIVELATNTETTTGSSTSLASTPAGVKAAIDVIKDGVPDAGNTLDKLYDLINASSAQAIIDSTNITKTSTTIQNFQTMSDWESLVVGQTVRLDSNSYGIVDYNAECLLQCVGKYSYNWGFFLQFTYGQSNLKVDVHYIILGNMFTKNIN